MIEGPGGEQLPPADHFTSERSFSRRDVIEIATEPFVATSHRLTFEAEKIYELAVEVQSGAPLTAMREDDATSVWRPPPPTVSACDDDRVFVLYSVDVDRSASSTLTVETDDDDTGGRCYLVGEWKPTADALLGFADFGIEVGAGPIAAQGGNMECGYMDGDWTVWFRDNGEGQITFNGTTNEFQVTHSDQRMAVTSSRSGTTAFKWTIKGEGAGTLSYTSHDVFWNMVMKIGPIAQDMSSPDAGPSINSHGFAFACRGNDLVLEGLYGLSHKEVQHVRVVEPE